jgi:pimeloyl-ACP methyl ester carboxylesterase
MRTLKAFVAVVAVVATAFVMAASAGAQEIESKFANVNGLRMHYLQTGGTGSPVILLHGYAQTSHMWRPLMTELGKTHRVIAPDLRGFGDTTKAESGYDKKTRS